MSINKRGFSIIEILIVLAIIALLAGIVVTNFTGIFGGAQEQATETVVKQSFETPLLKFRIDTGSYPNTSEGLQALIKAPSGKSKKWKGPYLKENQIPQDPWGKPYQYRFPGVKNTNSFDLWSFGPDGVESADDIGNWE